MSDILIEKGVPLPVEEPKAPEPVVEYPFGELEIGDSFVVVGLKKTALMTAFKSYAKASGVFWNVVVENTATGARIWRIDPEPDEDAEPEFDGIYRDADGEPLNDLYHDHGRPRLGLEDGVWLNMPDYVYHAQDRIGSSDLKVLASKKPEAWWYGSRHNPKREAYEVNEALLFGRALHKYCLEGEAAFRREFEKSPFDSYATKEGKAWKKACDRSLKTAVKPDTWDNVFSMGELLLALPDITMPDGSISAGMGKLLREGLAELTVFFSIDGIKARVRYDRFLRHLILDLKSFSSHLYGKNDTDTCIRIIRNMFYDVQRFWYDLGRNYLREFVRIDKVFGASPKQLSWLQDVAEEEFWQFLFVFFQKTSHKANSPSAPVVTPITRDPGDFTYIRGQERAVRAIKNYHRLVETFGLETPWVKINPPLNPDDTEFLVVFGDDPDADAPEPENADEDFDGDDEVEK